MYTTEIQGGIYGVYNRVYHRVYVHRVYHRVYVHRVYLSGMLLRCTSRVCS